MWRFLRLGASNDSQTGPSSQKSESVLEGGESGGYIATWDLGNPKAPTSNPG